MSSALNLKELITTVEDHLKDFRGCVEVENFRDFLLFNSNSDAPDNIMGMLGMGHKSQIVIAWDPFREIFFSRVVSGPMDGNSIILYTRCPPEIKDDMAQYLDTYQIELDDPFMDQFFTRKEREMFFTRKKTIVFVTASDWKTIENCRANATAQIQIENVYGNVLSLVAGFSQARTVFLLSGPDHNLAFNFNFSLLQQVAEDNTFLVDCYLDQDKTLDGIKFVQVNKDFEVTYLADVDTIDYKCQYTMVMPIKGFDVPGA